MEEGAALPFTHKEGTRAGRRPGPQTRGPWSARPAGQVGPQQRAAAPSGMTRIIDDADEPQAALAVEEGQGASPVPEAAPKTLSEIKIAIFKCSNEPPK